MLSHTKKIPREVWIGWISSLVEAYNMAIYSFIAPLFAPLLFPEASTIEALLFSYFLLFVASGLLYPAGALYYGFLGDRSGRQKLCIYATLGLGVATGMMGLLPRDLLGHGWLYFLCFIGAQYFFSGGEYHGSIVFSLEHSPQKSKGLMSALSCLFAVFGLLVANGLATFSLATQNLLWARGCFLLGAFGGLVSYYLKKYCQETPDFSSLSQVKLAQTSWFTFLKEKWHTILTVASLLSFFIVSYTFIFIFLPIIKLEENIAHISTFTSLALYGLCLVSAGLLADKIGICITLLIGLSVFSLALLPLLYLSPTLFLIQSVLTISASLVIGPLHSWTLSQFPVAERCRGIFISSALATSLFGGSTVPLCLLIFEFSNSLILCGLYPFFFALFSIVFLSIKEYKQRIEENI